MVLLGLFARCSLRRQRLGAALLALVPLVDLALLVTAALDLRYGEGEADLAHGLAAIYIGVSVAWAPRWFGGPTHGWPTDSLEARHPDARRRPDASMPATSVASGCGTCLGVASPSSGTRTASGALIALIRGWRERQDHRSRRPAGGASRRCGRRALRRPR